MAGISKYATHESHDNASHAKAATITTWSAMIIQNNPGRSDRLA
jgi:hypothetical protein